MPALPDASGNSFRIDGDVCLQWPPAAPRSRSPEPLPLRLGVMASGEGSNLEALVGACRDGSLAATVE
ncbi:MAG: hypothetical protein ACK522_01760, partial [Synechococcaceae cyanobacterium]